MPTHNYKPGLGKIRSFTQAPEGYTTSFEFARLTGQNTEFVGKLCRDGVLRAQKMLCSSTEKLNHRIRTWVIANEDLDYNERALRRFIKGPKVTGLKATRAKMRDLQSANKALSERLEELELLAASRNAEPEPELEPVEEALVPEDAEDAEGWLPCNLCQPPRLVHESHMLDHLDSEHVPTGKFEETEPEPEVFDHHHDHTFPHEDPETPEIVLKPVEVVTTLGASDSRVFHMDLTVLASQHDLVILKIGARQVVLNTERGLVEYGSSNGKG